MKRCNFILSLTLLLFGATLSFAKIELLSPLPIPEAEIIDLSTEMCDFACTESLLQRAQIFSFLAKYQKDSSGKLSNIAIHYKDILNLATFTTENESENLGKFTVALLQPKKVIGRYSMATTNAAIAYLLSKDVEFEIEVFDSVDEKESSLINTLQKIEARSYENIIAILTDEGANAIAKYPLRTTIYIPTVHSDAVAIKNRNILYGGIDYKEQIDTLIGFATQKQILFKDNSTIGEKLAGYCYDLGVSPLLDETIEEARSTQFNKLIKKNKNAIDNASVFLNTPLVKSSLLMSQIRYYEILPLNILSTQINYDPDIFSLTQPKDRQNLLLANSIIAPNEELAEYNELLENDFRYNWINYSTSIGIESFFTNGLQSDGRVFKEQMLDNQVQYKIEIVKAERNRFSSY